MYTRNEFGRDLFKDGQSQRLRVLHVTSTSTHEDELSDVVSVVIRDEEDQRRKRWMWTRY